MDIPKNISKEVSDFYNTSRNTFYAKDKGEKANEFETEIGDSKQDDFIPQVKVLRWGNEANASFRLIDDEPDTPEIKTEGNKIKFIKNKLEAHFYNCKIDNEEKSDGYEFEIILKEKPKTNKVRMSIETKGLKFYYQPSLKKEHKIGERGAVVITDTDVKDKDGKVIAHRPENVVGSYAVYHESKQGDYSKMGKKNYRAGKAFHIYRPKIIDSAGTEVWGKLNITDNLLTVEIPQEFLDNAVYPIKHAAGLTLGNETTGASVFITGEDIYGSLHTSPADADAGTMISITFRADKHVAPISVKGVLVLHSNLNIVANGVGAAVTGIASTNWYTSIFSTPPTLSGNTEYVLSIISNAGGYTEYDSGDANQGHYDSSNDYGTPTNPTDATHNNNKYSIYCTYWDAATTESPYIPKGIPKPFRGAQIDKAHPLNRGLVGFWLMNEGDGKKVFDLSGNGNLGTLTNMAFPPTAVSGWNAGRRGVGLRFDRNDDYVDLSNCPTFNSSQGSIEFWLKRNATGSIEYFFQIYENIWSDYFILHLGSTGKVQIIIEENDVKSNIETGVITNDTQWHHIVVTQDGIGMKIFVDGNDMSLSGADTRFTAQLTSWTTYIGRAYNSYANVTIDEVRIYNRALSAEEIKTLYLYPYGMFQRKDIIWIPEAGAGNLKSVNGVAFADIKSINGIAKANVKSVNGIATT